MATNAALGASGLSFAMGVINARGLTSLTSEVEALKQTMKSSSSATTNVESDSTSLAIDNDLASIDSPSDINTKSIAALVSRVQELESSSTAAELSMTSGLDKTVSELDSKMIKMNLDLQETLFDIETVIGLQPEIEDIIKEWRLLGTKAYVTDKFMFHANDCKLGLAPNKGNESAIHFAGANNPNWSMYCSNTGGYAPDGKAPPSHGDVKGYGLRMRVGDGVNNGLIVENSSGKGLFSVDGLGNTLAGSMKTGSLVDGTTTAYLSHVSNATEAKAAVSLYKDGATRVQSCNERNVVLGVDGTDKLVVEGHSEKSISIKNGENVNNTRFNHLGGNYIFAKGTVGTVFRNDTDKNDQMTVKSDGVFVQGPLSVDGVNVNNVVKTVPAQVARLEAKIEELNRRLEIIARSYLDMTKTVLLRNHVTDLYLNSNGEVVAPQSSNHAHFSIEYDS